MYEMYPEWGPARHRTDEATTMAGAEALQRALDQRDRSGERPDDN